MPVIDLRGSSPAMLARELRDGDLVVAHPEYWRLAAPLIKKFPRGVVGISSTAPCPEATSQALIAAGLKKFLHIYGSSETAGVGWREQASSPYTLFSFWERSARNANELVRKMPNGQFITYMCQDAIAWSGKRDFRPNGRIDEGVQIGGINVFPSKVRSVLLQHPDVLDVAVRLMRVDEGNRLKALVVPRIASSSHTLLHARLDTWVRTRLKPPERPRAFSFSDALPKNAAGKNIDWVIVPTVDSKEETV